MFDNLALESLNLLVFRVQFILHAPLAFLSVLKFLVHYIYSPFEHLIVSREVDARLAEQALLQTQVPTIVFIAHLLHVALKETLGLPNIFGFGVKST